MDYKEEIQTIRGQMASDFDFMALAMKDMGVTFRTGMAALGSEMEERFNQVEGRLRLQEQRFSRMLIAVEGAVDGWKPEMEEVKARLERLEDRMDSAA